MAELIFHIDMVGDDADIPFTRNWRSLIQTAAPGGLPHNFFVPNGLDLLSASSLRREETP